MKKYSLLTVYSICFTSTEDIMADGKGPKKTGYDDFFASIGTSIATCTIFLSVGKVFSQYYFIYIIVVIVVILVCATMYDHIVCRGANKTNDDQCVLQETENQKRRKPRIDSTLKREDFPGPVHQRKITKVQFAESTKKR